MPSSELGTEESSLMEDIIFAVLEASTVVAQVSITQIQLKDYQQEGDDGPYDTISGLCLLREHRKASQGK